MSTQPERAVAIIDCLLRHTQNYLADVPEEAPVAVEVLRRARADFLDQASADALDRLDQYIDKLASLSLASSD